MYVMYCLGEPPEAGFFYILERHYPPDGRFVLSEGHWLIPGTYKED